MVNPEVLELVGQTWSQNLYLQTMLFPPGPFPYELPYLSSHDNTEEIPLLVYNE